MSFDDVVDLMRSWLGERVVLTILPEGTVLAGTLTAHDAAGIDGALYGLDDGDGAPSGVALALFRDAFASGRLEDRELVVVQGQMVLRIARS